MGNRLLKCMLASYGLSALIGVMSILGGGNSAAMNLLGTSLIVSGALTLLLLALLLRNEGRHGLRWLMVFSSFMTMISAVIAVALIWLGKADQFLLEVMFSMLTLSVSAIHLGYLFFWKQPNHAFRAAVWSLTGLNLFLMCMCMCGLFFGAFFTFIFEFIDEDVFGRIIAVMIVLLLIGTVSLPVMNLILRGRHHENDKGATDRRVSIPICCPRCSFACELKVGQVLCPQCKLAMKFDVEEPRCQCGYLLYRFEGSSCPECSRSIPDYMRWENLTPSSESSG